MKTVINQKHKEQLINCCFDWLISNQKLAVEAYSMTVLYIIGKEFDWVHPELKNILLENIDSKSARYKARSLKLIKLM